VGGVPKSLGAASEGTGGALAGRAVLGARWKLLQAVLVAAPFGRGTPAAVFLRHFHRLRSRLETEAGQEFEEAPRVHHPGRASQGTSLRREGTRHHRQ